MAAICLILLFLVHEVVVMMRMRFIMTTNILTAAKPVYAEASHPW